jgi:hypothetical protein
VKGELYPNWRDDVGDAADGKIYAKAWKVYEWAVRTAPVGHEGHYGFGEGQRLHYFEDIHVFAWNGGYRIAALQPHSIFLEFGTRYMRAYHTLGIALDAAKG